MKKLIAFSFIALLTGCAHAPNSQEIANADYGQYPSNYESTVKSFYSTSLKDPDSAVYSNITSPNKAYMGNAFMGAKYGYLVCVTMNARNGFGGYVGYKTDGLLIHNDSVIEYLPKGEFYGRQFC